MVSLFAKTAAKVGIVLLFLQHAVVLSEPCSNQIVVRKFVALVKSHQPKLAKDWIEAFLSQAEPLFGRTFAHRLALLIIEGGAAQLEFLAGAPTGKIVTFGQGISYDLDALIERLGATQRRAGGDRLSETELLQAVLRLPTLQSWEPKLAPAADEEDELEGDVQLRRSTVSFRGRRPKRWSSR